MKRSLLLLLLVALPAAADGEFDGFRDSFRAAFGLMGGSEMPGPEDRLAAVEAVATFGHEDSTKLLVQGIELEQGIIDELRARRELIRSGRDRSLKGALPEPHLRTIKAQLDGEYKVMEAIVRGLEKLTDRDAIKHLVSNVLSRHRHWKCRAIAAEVLGKIGDRGYLKLVVKALKDKDARVRSSVLIALGRMRAEEALEDVMKALDDDDWTVRSAAIDTLGKIRDPRAFEALLAQMGEEEGRLADDCAESLAKITGQDFGRVASVWGKWWEDHREEVLKGHWPEPDPQPEPKNPEDDRYYHGIPVKSDRTIFIIDISESMSYSSTEFQEKPKEGELSRLEVARRELVKAIRQYPEKGTFGLIAFHTVVKQWRPRLVPAKPQMKEDGVEWVEELEYTGTTNIYAALELAFEMGGMGVGDRYYPPAVDTVFLLSDGAPTNQDLTDDDPERILRAVREWNRIGRVKIHTIGLKGHSASFMSALARENGGTYSSRE